jgi:hypothetical protein
MPTVESIYLVSCVKRKLDCRAPAKDMYTSDWFKKARTYVESSGCPWFILSAKYGLLRPDELIDPYEQTLRKMRSSERRAWTTGVEENLYRLPDAHRVIIFAGVLYRALLIEPLNAIAAVEVPMEGLGSGRQLQWLGTHSPR